MGWFDIAGSLLDVAGGLFSADMQNSATESMQQRNIDWEREQLQNKHQWEVEDLRKAGLNPILSAPNASSAVSAGSPQGANPDIKLSKTLEALSNSALVKKQEELAGYDAETRRIQALAQRKLANVEENKAPSTIGVNESQRWLNLQNAERIQHLWPMEVAYQKANIDYTMQKIINSILETQAKVQYLDKAGDAQLMIGSGAQMQGLAAMQNADTNRMLAETMEKNGVSQRMINDVMAGKLNQDIVESATRVSKILTENEQLNFNLKKDMLHNPNYERTGGGNWFTETVFGLGEYLGELNPLKGMFK